MKVLSFVSWVLKFGSGLSFCGCGLSPMNVSVIARIPIIADMWLPFPVIWVMYMSDGLNRSHSFCGMSGIVISVGVWSCVQMGVIISLAFAPFAMALSIILPRSFMIPDCFETMKSAIGLMGMVMKRILMVGLDVHS